MVDFKKVHVGQKLKIVGEGAPGFAKLGDVVVVNEIGENRIYCTNEKGETAFFALTCGAQRLEEVNDDAKL